MKADRDAILVVDALMMSLWRRGKACALLDHSDQGAMDKRAISTLAGRQRQHLLNKPGRHGWDNSAMESVFPWLKAERNTRQLYPIRDEARADRFDFIKCFYNPRRRHSTQGYLSPMEFEARTVLA